MKNQIKELKNTEEADHYDREVISSVSHDIKSPLIGILEYAGLIAEESFSLEHRKMASEIERAGKDILQVINNMMAMVKMEAGKEIPDFRWVNDLGEEFEEILRTFRLQARAKKIKLELVVPEPINRVYWDMEKLRLHVFNNLLSNALKSTPSGGKIRVICIIQKEKVRILIEDSGKGIPEEEKGRILEKGNWLKKRSGHTPSHGLGLYNARLFVERHGGKISLFENSIYEPNEFVSEDFKPDDYEKLSGARFLIELPVFSGFRTVTSRISSFQEE